MAKSNYYFTDETQEAILKYQASDSKDEKEYLFKEFIEYPFNKMVENVVHRWKADHIKLPYKDIKHEIVIFLISKIPNYNPEKGRAFSYFSWICRNFVWAENQKAYQEKKIHDDVDDSVDNLELSYEYEYEKLNPKKMVVKFLDYCYENLEIMFPEERDRKIAYAVLELFEKADELESEEDSKFNKKALYIMIREKTRVETKFITPIVKRLKAQYKKVFFDHEDDDEVYDLSDMY